MRITVLNRGGLAVYGGHYDPHTNEAIVRVREGETVALTVEYPSAPTAPAKASSGIACTTPTVTGSKVAATLSAMQEGGYCDITATVAGATRKVRIRAKADTQADHYE
jgi:hypothetical protein